ATREPERFGIKDTAQYILYGASPRASINMIITARALAYIRGRNYVLLEDIADMAHDVMRHRLVMSYEAMSDGVNAEAIIDQVLAHIPIPTQSLKTYATIES
ncbi:MAG: ATPase, partial [Chloroflexi bacterium]|nr:ATPase [Chloroflexota bacterium]